MTARLEDALVTIGEITCAKDLLDNFYVALNIGQSKEYQNKRCLFYLDPADIYVEFDCPYTHKFIVLEKRFVELRLAKAIHLLYVRVLLCGSEKILWLSTPFQITKTSYIT